MLDGRKQFAAQSCIKPRPMFSMCLLEDANSVQVALMQVLNLLGSGQMDPKTAGLMLYGLQTASANLRHVKFEAEKATDVVIDRNTVDQTCINGPQWFAQDFADQADDQAEDQAEEAEQSVAAASAGQAPAEPAADKVHPEKISPEKVRANKVRANKIRASNRKWPERAAAEQPPEWMQRILAHFPPATEARVDAG
jgi:hypothetical protein